MKKTLLLVDVQNIYYTTRDAYGRHFDYNRFWERATANRQVVKAIAYAVDRGDVRQRQFQAILKAIGFEVKLKPFIKRADGSAKGDWDVGITLDAMEYARHADLLVLATGDGDFALLVDRVRRDYGIPVEVYGVPGLTALSLINAATGYVPVEDDLLLGSPGKR